MGLSLCKSFRFLRGRYDIIRKGTEFSQKFTTWTVFSFMTVRFHSIHMSDHAYMWILSHNVNLFVNFIQSVFLLFPSALLTFSSLRFVKCFADVYHISAHINNFVHFSEWATSQFLFTNIDGELPESERLTRLCDSHVAVNFKYIEWRKISASFLKKFLHILVVFSFAHLMAGQIDLEAQLLNMNLDFPLPLLLFQIQNSGEVMLHFLFYLITVTDSCFICWRILQYQMLFIIDSFNKSNTKMQLTNITHISQSQNNITTLQVDIKRVAFASFLWHLVEGQLQVMCEVVLAVIVIRLFLSGCDLSAWNCEAFSNLFSGWQVAPSVILKAECVFSQFLLISQYQCCDEIEVFHL